MATEPIQILLNVPVAETGIEKLLIRQSEKNRACDKLGGAEQVVYCRPRKSALNCVRSARRELCRCLKMLLYPAAVVPEVERHAPRATDVHDREVTCVRVVLGKVEIEFPDVARSQQFSLLHWA